MRNLPRKPHRKHRFPCEQCGALLKFAPGSSALACSHCGHRQPIAPSDRPILEHDFAQALQRLASTRGAAMESLALKCGSCAADFELPEGTPLPWRWSVGMAGALDDARPEGNTASPATAPGVRLRVRRRQ